MGNSLIDQLLRWLRLSRSDTQQTPAEAPTTWPGFVGPPEAQFHGLAGLQGEERAPFTPAEVAQARGEYVPPDWSPQPTSAPTSYAAQPVSYDTPTDYSGASISDITGGGAAQPAPEPKSKGLFGTGVDLSSPFSTPIMEKLTGRPSSSLPLSAQMLGSVALDPFLFALFKPIEVAGTMQENRDAAAAAAQQKAVAEQNTPAKLAQQAKASSLVNFMVNRAKAQNGEPAWDAWQQQWDASQVGLTPQDVTDFQAALREKLVPDDLTAQATQMLLNNRSVPDIVSWLNEQARTATPQGQAPQSPGLTQQDIASFQQALREKLVPDDLVAVATQRLQNGVSVDDIVSWLNQRAQEDAALGGHTVSSPTSNLTVKPPTMTAPMTQASTFSAPASMPSLTSYQPTLDSYRAPTTGLPAYTGAPTRAIQDTISALWAWRRASPAASTAASKTAPVSGSTTNTQLMQDLATLKGLPPALRAAFLQSHDALRQYLEQLADSMSE